MNKENIIKALECCAAGFCVGCPLGDKKFDSCNGLDSEIISFIEQQKNNIEHLKKQLEIADKETQSAHKANVEYIIECEERRKKSLEKLGEDIKIEFYKNFEELIPSIMSDIIDELVKKVIGSNAKENE